MLARLLIPLVLLLAFAGPAQAAPLHADRDDDGVFDDLEVAVRASKPTRDLSVIVVLDKSATRARVEGLEEQVESLDASRRFKLIDAFAAEVDSGDVRELAAQGVVVHVERDKRVHATNASAQSSFGVTKARADAPALDGDGDGNAASYSAADLVAAVIDTGIDATHTNLNGGKVLAFQDFTDGSYNDVDAAIDDNGHGTHVSATIAGDGGGAGAIADEAKAGVAPAAGLVGLKVLGADGSGDSKDVIAAIDWVVANKAAFGIEAVNLSLGSDGCSDGQDADSLAVNAANAAGLVVAVAAGNEGPGKCTVGSPGAAAGALTVGAMADMGLPTSLPGGFFQADFSSRGPTADGRIKPDISAPGVLVTSAWPVALDTEDGTADGFLRINGTSMATPFVAGVALLLRDQNSALTPAQVKTAMTSTAIDWGTPGLDIDYGAGRLDAYAALASVNPALTAPPAVPQHRFAQGLLAGTGAETTHSFTVDSTAFPIGLTLTVSDPDADFDLFVTETDGDPVTVFDRRGSAVTGAVSGGRSDAVFLPANTAGPFLVRIRSFTGSGGWSLDLSNAALGTIAPTNGDPPAVTGITQDGATLSAFEGEWNGTQPMTFGYQWQRCESDGSGCADVDGATTQSYLVGPPDIGKRLRVVVTGTNSVGSATSTSATSGIVTPAPPTLSADPAVTGTVTEGQTLTANDGTWAGTAPITFTRQWLHCSTLGLDCQPITGATGTTYELSAADVGFSIRLRVTATNAGGSVTRDSATTAVVRERPEPQLVTLPTLQGSARDGSTLAVSDGDWKGAPSIALSFAWLRCDTTGVFCNPIASATQNRYRLRAGDIASRIRARVTATNSAGTASASTAPSAVVRGVAPDNVSPPTLRGRAARGRNLRVRRGSWEGSTPLTFAIQWVRCNARGSRCRRIRGATESSYRPGNADRGRRLRARVRATNVAGTQVVRTAASGLIPEARGRRRN